MAGEIKYTELDFAKIKENLKNFLKSQDKFTDYNFDGSGMSVLLDILAYNTAYMGFYMNMVASEMFLDSAVLRESIVSRAKHLGYTPRSAKTARAVINLEVFPGLNTPAGLSPTPASIYISTATQFTAISDGKTYYFTPAKATTIYPIAGRYIAAGLELVEGRRLVHQWTYNASSVIKQRFIIPNANIDTSLLTVSVQTSSSNLARKVYNLHKDLNELTPNDAVYFLQETDGGKYEILFGDGVIGKPLVDGNIVIVEYVVSTGEGAEGIARFSATNKIAGYPSYQITTIEAAKDYEPPESDASVKFLAPLNYDSQNRAITKLDYETLIKKDVPEIEYLRVWGGEDNVPPNYGKVFIAVKPRTGFSLSEDQKNRLIEGYIRPRNLISMEVVIVEPDYLGLIIDTLVMYKGSTTTYTENDIQEIVKNRIKIFCKTELNGFDADFRYSRLVKFIDTADQSIDGNLTSIKMRYRFYPPFDVATRYEIQLNNSISKGDAANGISSITSSGFYYKGVVTYIGDNGKGNLYYYRIANDKKIIIESNIGSVNYTTGELILYGIEVQKIANDLSYIDLYITPGLNDITALRNQILIVLDEDIHVNVKDLSKTVGNI